MQERPEELEEPELPEEKGVPVVLVALDVEDVVVVAEPVEDEVVVAEPVEGKVVVAGPVEDEVVVAAPVEDEIVVAEPFDEGLAGTESKEADARFDLIVPWFSGKVSEILGVAERFCDLKLTKCLMFLMA